MRGSIRHSILFVAALVTVTASSVAAAESSEAGDESSWVPVPFRVRNLTFPTMLTMGFMPRPADPIGAGAWALELNVSTSNYFQMSSGVEEWLANREGPRAPLSPSDVEAMIVELDDPQFFFDGELNAYDLGVHFGITPRLMLSLRLGYFDYGGGFLDSTIEGFHDLIGIGQAGREFITRDNAQLLFMSGGEHTVLYDRPSPGGFADPMLSLSYSFPTSWKSWSFSLQGAVKPPLADVDDWLSTGSWDVGVQATAQRVWRRNALVFNLSVVVPGDFEIERNFDPADLPSLNVAYLRRLSDRTTFVIQTLYSENIFRDEVNTDLAAYEFQATAGVKVEALGGRIGLAFTENLFNFDNTPDFGIHLSYAVLID